MDAAEREPLLHEVNPQHRLDRERRPALFPSGAYGATSSTTATHGTTRSLCARTSRLRVRLIVPASARGLRLTPAEPISSTLPR
jgi:hypothetical protein